MIQRFRQLALSAVLLPLALSCHAASAALPAKVEQALKANKISNNSLSVMTVPLSGQTGGLQFNSDVSVNPASTMKLVTTYAALELLGPNHQWKTEFYADGPLKDGVLHGNLYLKGGGDPKLNMEKLWLLLRDLRINGVHQVQGDLVLDRSFFVAPQLPAFNDDGGDANKPFLVKPDSLLVNLKAQRFITRAEGGKVSIAMDPPIATIRIDNQVRVLKAAKCPAWPDIRYNAVDQYDGTTLIVSGQLAEGCSAQTYLSLLDHPSYAAGAVRGIWQELGGKILGKDRLGPVPEDARMLVRAFSPDVVEIVRDINKYSNNTMARQLFLSIGAQFRTEADKDDSLAAQRVIRSWLARKGITAPHLVLENGSGLSRAERISAREMALILQAAWRSPYAAEFRSSMPLVAMDGTMRRRLQRTPLVGEAHIKTGTLNNVRAIAGYSRDSNGQDWAVVAILNDPKPWGATSILDQVLLDTYSQPKR
ncbi:MAG: D-alanyl-D-alanine carboxypeptidase/D-alanyl-D-alanine-endopeptidase [Pseudomonas sp.]|jgi:D-alanyl-D-alanine carboxypeptidase/D-alanyl-D-alanine-endopeptidase (penicillin-binding protein 4)|uniref:D-alanyl-D-alanine carboxypeptidase n=1 Tax=Ectopseudomonas composti TaxID=658457 RepID=A0ABP3C1T6_9GAMM|nr:MULTISPECIES: D-alanyl-D-alanine carboxypeptidase/D-alanyl-D-alanine-endopeptidase [Pseudomonas]EZH84138.1 D-alanyl-D-alanine carboxypeptidase [Pseudomonas composti]MDN5514336.1 D-alanyl-D-alanine carboxypeptidase/D-alanyl-D-alanine-endopeptidase [Pseudomonas sp.]QNH03657.1 D-alanyl-D-alanine carboxypeptidase/D-alanyl-D-alanine-endopeptidase [Pseudomonas sp. B11D7D]